MNLTFLFHSVLIAVLSMGDAGGKLPAGQSYVGRCLPSEKSTYVDKVSGLTVTILTTYKGYDYKFYQTHPSWTADGKHVVFLSDRTGSMQLYAINENSGRIIQLTDDTGGGFGYLDRRANRIYRLVDGKVWAFDIGAIIVDGESGTCKPADTYRREVADVPGNFKLGSRPTLDADGERLYFEFSGPKPDYLPSGIVEVNIITGKCRKVLQAPFRVGHVQANPLVPGLIMLCDATSNNTSNRMWLTDTHDPKSLRPFYKETHNEWITHEVWAGPDRALFVFWPHKDMGDSPRGLATIRLADNKVTLHADRHRYWHFNATPDLRYAVADTMEGELYLIDLVRGEDKLLTQGHRTPSELSHCHPSISPDGKRVFFASKHLGIYDLMTVEIPLWDNIPPIGSKLEKEKR